jgi:hypothetical protein
VSIAKQFFNIVMEKLLSFCSSLTLIAGERVKSIKVMNVSIHIAIATCCVAISYPSFAQSPLVVPRNACGEVSYSSLQSREFCFELTGKFSAVPTSESRVEVTKLEQDGFSKPSGSGAVSNVSLDSKISKDGDKGNDDVEVPGHIDFLALLPLWMITFFIMADALWARRG